MPRLSDDRHIIQELGLETEVQQMVAGGLTDSRIIAKRLNEDPVTKTRLRGQRIYPTDIERFLGTSSKAVSEQRERAVMQSPEVQNKAMALKNGLDRLLVFMEKAANIADQVILDFGTERIKYMNQEPVKGPNGGLTLLVEYPHRHVNSMEKAVRIIKTTVDAVKNDATVQQILKAGVVNLQSGHSDEEMFEEMVRVCERLGHTRADALRAWAESKAAEKPIDVPVQEEDDEPDQ